MKLLLLKGYNNYQNRWFKYEDSLSAYRTIVGANNYYDYTTDINFNINDGISTTITLNLTDTDKPNFMSDYVIVYENNTIKHRWFVIEQLWNRKSQYILTLKRDVLVDFREQYQSAPMLVERGYPSLNSTELYNTEGIKYSQIKTHQIDLIDPNVQWVVVYLNKNRRGKPYASVPGDTYDKGNGYPAFISNKEIKFVDQGGGYIDKSAVEVGDHIQVTNTYLWIQSPVENWGTDIQSSLYLGEDGADLEPFRPVVEGKIKDAAYDMVVFPYANNGLNIRLSCYNKYGVSKNTIMPWYEGLRLATNMKYTMQDEVYDIQLLPVCPIEGVTTSIVDLDGRRYNQITVPQFLSDQLVECIDVLAMFDVKEVKGTGNDKTFKAKFEPIAGPNGATNLSENNNIFFGLYADNKDRIITTSINYPYTTSTMLDKKIDSECRFIRIISPTGKAMWDYNVTKNGNVPTQYIIYFTFKPGMPYMHIRTTEFGGLYGDNYVDDTRGLIDMSSYSISTVIDSWMQYIQQNSNYQDIFNRNIDSMEIQHNTALGLDITNAIFGSVGASATGLLTGAMVGGVPGAIVGAIAGGVTSLGGGIADTVINQTLRDEQMSLTKDMHEMNLAQIQARPDTISKLSNIDIDSHLVPYAEVYSASADEVEYLRNLLTYRGYTINRIHSVLQEELNAGADGQQSLFVSGRLLECPGLQEDAHVFSEINNELMTGVRIFL